MGTNTGLGIGIGIPFKNFSSGGRQPLPPDLKASLKGVWIAYGKSNNDADRSIVKNLVDPDNPFVISNAAYKLNSGYGKYEEDFTTWVGAAISINNGAGFKIEKNNTGWWGFSTYGVKATNEFKIKVTNCRDAFSWKYKDAEGIWQTMNITKDGIYTLPASQERDGHDAPRFFSGNPNATYNGLTVEQIPSYQGAFVTDGINDMITSTKTVQEMLGGSNEFTVVSMMANLDSVQMMCNSNYNNTNGYNPRNTLEPNGVISMLGYTDKNGTTNNLNLIMGDKDSIKLVDEVNFNSDYVFYPAQYYGSYYKAAWYWTVIANKVLTTDEINQVIAYFNLDRTLKPDILCNITKQGITNDNHADFNDKLIDYSGNGRDIQMNNLAWKGGSGIAAKPFETIKDYTILSDEARQELTIYNEFSYKVKSNTPNHYWVVQSIIKDNTSYQVTIITDKDCYWINSTSFTNNEGNKESIRKEYPVKANTPTQVTICGLNEFEYPEDIEPTTAVSFVNLSYTGEVTVTFIPSYKGGILLDGVNDYGKVTGLPIYKDYTVIADYIRTFAKENVRNAPILSKSKKGDDGAFIFNYVKYSTSDTLAYDTLAYSFASTNNVSYINDFERNIYYQSKYTNNGNSINAGKGVDTDGMWLGTIRDNDYRFFNGAIYSLMTFPYSMSEFLIERQLKKHKLGTLYPDMVEFRPVIKSNASYDNIVFYYKNEKVENGTYLTVGSSIGMHIRLSSNSVNEIKSITINGIPATFKFHDANNNIYQYDFNLTSKSPQKINITIDEYIRYEDIVQPYPSLFTLIDYDTEEVYSWGSKLKVGARFKGNVVNLLPNMYEWQGNVLYNGEVLDWGINPGVVAKEMVFSWNMPFKYLIDNNEPKCILSPRLLRIPNSSYKILGYIPDISGHGNNGVIHNSAYAEGSGVNEDGSYQLDGVDDFVTIPTIAGKQVLIKLNWQNKAIGNLIYDQRDNSSTTSFAIMPISINDTTNNKIAYQTKNANGITYIDGIRNEYIESYSLENIIHNITITNPDVSNKTVALGASNRTTADYFAKYALYDFMLFDKISTDDKIKQLNEYVGIEGNFVEWNPTITTNISSTYTISPNIRKSDGITVKLVKGNIYSTSITGNLVLDIVPPNKDLDEVTNVIIDGKSYTPIKYQYADYYRVEIPLVFPQEINITIDEYIRYESIEQPYPIFLNYIDKETNKTYTWGDKVKVDSILKISGYKNLFENGDTSLGGSNGYSVNGSSELIALGTLLTSEILVNKINTGVRSSVIWNLNTPKPLFAYDPSIINNVGLKNLGYLPDITGQGRHLLLNEFAYEGMSGINGYPVVFGKNKTWIILRSNSDNANYEVTPNIIKIYKSDNNSALLYSPVYNDGVIRKISVPSFKLKVTGLKEGQTLGYKYVSESDRNLVSTMAIIRDGIYDIPQSYPIEPDESTPNESWIGFITNTKGDYDATLEVLSEYEGSLYFDGVNDYGTVKNLTYGVKSLLMKINWSKNNSMLYDQRNNNNSYFGIFTSNVDINGSKVFAYGARNNGSTYIDGVLNKYIY